MEVTMKGGSDQGLVVIVKCSVCGDTGPVPHKEFTSINCDRKPCVGRVVATNGQGPRSDRMAAGK